MTNPLADAGEIRTALMDGDDWEYELAGHLVGTDWVFPEIGVDTIGSVKQTEMREQGETYKHPEVVLKYAGTRLPVSGFRDRIDPDRIGDIEPAGQVAERIVDVITDG